MKVIYIDNIPAEGEPSVTLYADSSVCRDGAPLFLPDHYGPWAGEVCVAARVGRLGKGIEPRFAHRYIDGLTLVHVLRSPGSDLPRIVDQAVVCGQWHAPVMEGMLRIQVMDGSEITETALEVDSLELPRAVAAVSCLSTVKTGDMLIFSAGAVPTSLTPDTYISANLNNQHCIRFKVK